MDLFFSYLYLPFLIHFLGISFALELDNCATNVAVIICKGNGAETTVLSENLDERHVATVSMEQKLNRQVQQTLVLLKSIAITQKYAKDPVYAHFWSKSRRQVESCVNFILVGKDPNIVKEIQDEIFRENWDPELTSLIKLKFVQAAYPKVLKWMEHVYRLCATLRLFLPEILPSIEKLIYVDTDIIFLRPPKLLQLIFDDFTQTQIAGITPELVTGDKKVDDLYNPQFYNTGVMLMHLERMRKAKWSSKVALVAELTLPKAFYGDQDVLIVYFKFHQEELFHLDCHWNYMPKYCQVDCGVYTGISVVHGVVASFFLHQGSPFEVMFRYYKDYPMSNFCVEDFNQGLGNRLWTRKKDSNDSRNFCARDRTNNNGNNPTFTSAVMKTLKNLEISSVPLSCYSRRLILSKSASGDENYVTPPIEKLNTTSDTIVSSTKEGIVIAVTLIESQFKVYKQVELLTTMLKSLLALSSSKNQELTVVILTDKKLSCEKVNKTFSEWNGMGRTPMHIECVTANYTKGHQWMGRVFKPGVFFRLFYPDLIPHDAVIYVDTDFIFKKDISHLWSEFKNFKETHIIAATKQLSTDGPTNKKFPETAFQAGIMLMNLTRMRQVKWSTQLTMLTEILKPILYSDTPILPVQTLLHLYFKYHPEEMYELNANWNFLPHYCHLKFDSENLDNLEQKPSIIYAIHGVNDSFTRADTMEPLFQKIYLSYVNWSFSDAPPTGNMSLDEFSPCSQSERFKFGWFKSNI